MKKVFIILVICTFTFASFAKSKVNSMAPDSLTNKETVYYVSAGIHQNSALGTRDLPFNSLEQARNAIRASRKKSTDKDIRYRVVLLQGEYKIKNSFILADQDSGTVNTPIVYEGEKTGTVTLSGGMNIPPESCKKITRNIKGYTKISSEFRDQVYYVDLKGVFPKEINRQDSVDMTAPKSYLAPVELCINGKMMTLARYPNSGFAKTGINIDSTTFKFDDNRISRWKNEPSGMILGYLKFGWSFSFNRISSVNENEKTISLLKSPAYSIGKNRPVYLSNLLTELDVQGEYYIDYQSSILYFILPLGAEISKSAIELSILGEGTKSIIEMNKTSNITIRNLTITLGRYGAINMNNSNGITLSNLVIHNMGNFGIKATGVKNHFKNLHLLDLGGTGITLTGGDRINLVSSNNIIENCEIGGAGRIQRTFAPGISIGGVGNIIRNCRISNLPNTAIWFSGNENIIEKNEIFHVCYETCDAGAIYSGRDWGSRGNVIISNYIHDINSINKDEGGVHGIYLDDCASGISIKSNIISNIDADGVVIGGGHDNIITENIFKNCGLTAILADKRDVGWINLKKGDSFNLKEKVEKLNYKSEIWSKKYPKLAAIFDNGYELATLPSGNVVNNNVFWNNKTNFKEARTGALKGVNILNNAELKQSPFITDTVKDWKFDSNVLDVLPKSFIPIPLSEIGLLK